MTTIQVILIFPFGGLKDEFQRSMFDRLVECSLKETNPQLKTNPKAKVTNEVIIVIENQTIERIKIDADQKHHFNLLKSNPQVEILPVWSVDTCQRWLAGWGHIFDKGKDHWPDRIVLIPGDINQVGSKKPNFTSMKLPPGFLPKDFLSDITQLVLHGWEYLSTLSKSAILDLDEQDRDAIKSYIRGIDGFFERISSFISLAQDDWDLIIGDYTSGDPHSAKELIDTHGTFSLLSNWFREVFRKVTNEICDVNNPQDIGLRKPRSEFLNIRRDCLEKFLKETTPFAYEQTLNMIIRWYLKFKESGGIYKFDLGTIQDDKEFRKYRNCVDQIERTERMLRYTWRELKEPNKKKFTATQLYRDAYHDFMKDYSEHDHRSTAIREAANIAIENFLI